MTPACPEGRSTDCSPRYADTSPISIIAQEIVNDLDAALEQFRLIAGDINGDT
jgi:hypothetical protein